MPPAGTATATAWEVSGQDEALVAMLFPHLTRLRMHRVADAGGAVVISASCRAQSACCPRCGQQSSRVHGGYSRVVADGAAGGRGFGLELAGRASARLALLPGIAVHPSTVLRLVTALPVPGVAGAPEVPGIDDFALRKGHVYGTVLVDIATADVAGLLPDREAATVEAWLTAHPGVKVICRDRAGAYAEGSRAGAPEATQVADRWHLWHNLAEHAAKTVARHHACLKQPAPCQAVPAGTAEQETAEHDQEPAGPAVAGEPADGPAGEGRLTARTRERYTAIHELLQAGESLHAISRVLSLSRPTVRRFARVASIDELLAEATGRESKLDPFRPYICQRWNEGLTDAAALHAGLRQRGFTGSVRTVRRYVAPFRQAATAPDPAPATPKARQVTRWLLTRPDHLQPEDQARLNAIRASCPHTGTLARHVASFAEMMTGRTGNRDLESWLTAVEADDSQPDLRSFAAGIRNDQQAVTNGLTLPYSSGKVEGTVNKIKMLKRQMYGRAGFGLLRTRVILHPA